MIIYTVFFLIIFLLSVKIKSQKYTIFDFFMLTALICFSGFRTVGTDYLLYSNIYDYITIYNPFIRSGQLFGKLFIYFYNANFSYQTLIFMISTITNLFIYFLIKRYSKKPGIAIILYVGLGFYPYTFNAFRQSLSISVALMSMHYLYNKKYIKSFIFCVIALFSHNTSLILIAVFSIFIKFPKLNIKANWMLMISLVLFLFYDKFFNIIVTKFNFLSIYQFNQEEYKGGIGTMINVAIYLCLFFTLLRINKSNINSFWMKIFCLGTLINMFSIKNWLFNRIALDFLFITPILLSNLFYEKNLIKHKIITSMYYILPYIYYLMYIYSYGGIYPYHSIFF